MTETESVEYLEKVVGEKTFKVDTKWTTVSDLAYQTILPKLPYPADGSCDGKLATFFTHRRLQSEENLQKILELLKSIEKSHAAMRKHVKPLFLLLGEQADGQEPWCCTENENRVSQIIAELYRIFDMTMAAPGPLSAFFLRDFECVANPATTTFAHILKKFRPTLGAKNPDLSRYPAAKRAFLWLVMQVKHPYLDEYLQDIIIPSLNMLDDHEIISNALGLCCLSHTFINTPKSIVKHTGWGLVVFEHYKKYLNINKPKLIDEVMPEIFRILKMIEVDPHTHSAKLTLYDTVLECLLSILETTDRDGLDKVIWMRHLANYMNIMGHAIMHWFDRIVRILVENTNCIEPKRWYWIIKCTQVCISNTWMKPNSRVFTEIILRVVYNINVLFMFISPADNNVVKDTEKLILDCLTCLKTYKDYPAVRKQILQILNNPDEKFSPDFIDAAKIIFRSEKEKRAGKASKKK